jgi:hypothetical protein
VIAIVHIYAPHKWGRRSAMDEEMSEGAEKRGEERREN